MKTPGAAASSPPATSRRRRAANARLTDAEVSTAADLHLQYWDHWLNPKSPWYNVTKVTVREALRDAMAEEMRRDDNVFLMGEEVAEYQGAYKISRGLLDQFGAGVWSIRRSPSMGLPGWASARRFAGLEAHRRVHDVQLRHAGNGSS